MKGKSIKKVVDDISLSLGCPHQCHNHTQGHFLVSLGNVGSITHLPKHP